MTHLFWRRRAPRSTRGLRSIHLLLVLGFASATPAFAFETFSEAYQQGQAQIKEKKYAEGRAALVEALTLAQTAPEKARAQFAIGLAYQGENQHEKAAEEFVKLFSMLDVPPAIKSGAGLQLSRIYVLQKKYPEARTALSNALALEENTAEQRAELQLYYASTYLYEKKLPAARTEYKKVVDATEAPPLPKGQAQAQYAMTFNTEGKYELAKAELAKVLEIPLLPPLMKVEVQIYSGDIFQAEKNFTGARSAYEMVPKMDGASPAQKAKAELRLKNLAALEQRETR